MSQLLPATDRRGPAPPQPRTAAPSRRLSSLLLALLAVSITIALTLDLCLADDDDFRCGTDVSIARDQQHISPVDTVTALFVFAKFPDGDDLDPCDSESWPQPAVVPAWADSLFEMASPWDTVGSLTHYFDIASEQKHLVKGVVYEDVVTVDSSIVSYVTQFPNKYDRIRQTNTDVLLKVAADYDSVLATTFDENGDDYLDQLCVFWRSGQSTTSGYRINEGFGAIATGTLDATLHFANGDSINTDNECALAIFAVDLPGGDVELVRSKSRVFHGFVHEYGHHLIEAAKEEFGAPLLGHLASIGPYGVMDGSYGGGVWFTTYTRYHFGWIDPVVITSSSGGGDTTIVVTAGPVNGSYAKIETQDPEQYFMLEARNSDSAYFDLLTDECFFPAVDPTGLLITHCVESGAGGFYGSDPEHPNYGFAPMVDPEIATGMFAQDSGEPDPVAGRDEMQAWEHLLDTHHPDDLFEPGNNNVFAPGGVPKSVEKLT